MKFPKSALFGIPIIILMFIVFSVDDPELKATLVIIQGCLLASQIYFLIKEIKEHRNN